MNSECYSTMYKKYMKVHRLSTAPIEPVERAPPKPILGIYLIGWGLSIIVCGIVAAISLDHYSGSPAL